MTQPLLLTFAPLSQPAPVAPTLRDDAHISALIELLVIHFNASMIKAHALPENGMHPQSKAILRYLMLLDDDDYLCEMKRYVEETGALIREGIDENTQMHHESMREYNKEKGDFGKLRSRIDRGLSMLQQERLENMEAECGRTFEEMHARGEMLIDGTQRLTQLQRMYEKLPGIISALGYTPAQPVSELHAQQAALPAPSIT